MPNKKLFVFEGQKTEITIAENLVKNFTGLFFSSEGIMCAYCTTIYSLYKEISKDKYLDMFGLLKKCEIFSKQRKKYIKIDSTVSVLSSFPVFLFDYNSKTIADLILKNKRYV